MSTKRRNVTGLLNKLWSSVKNTSKCSSFHLKYTFCSVYSLSDNEHLEKPNLIVNLIFLQNKMESVVTGKNGYNRIHLKGKKTHPTTVTSGKTSSALKIK